ncbi:MAG: hypothetical protein JO257_30010 [Deltaproteobacteria bacterium]|nr:hypothetical protein [Deltaproteobacteria bacterium]
MWRWVVVLAACGATPRPEDSRYDADFETVFAAVSEAAHARAREVVDEPAQAMVRTAWQQVAHLQPAPETDASMGGGPGRSWRPKAIESTRYYARYDIHIAGPRPWHVEIAAHASSWSPGMAQPTVLPDADPPAWLVAQRNRLADDIHERLRASAATTR